MAKKIVKTNLVAALLVVIAVLGHSLIGNAGSLEPSASPGPTMKTLDEVEPRIPISQSDMPKQINTPGSYYLTEDVTSAGNGITIYVDDVTIDLSGFAIIGSGNGAGFGVYMSNRRNVEIRNGTIRDFDRGLYEGNSAALNHRVISVRAISNSIYGIYLNGSNHQVRDCTVNDNGTSSASTVYAIRAGSDSVVTGNTVYNNGNSATSSYVYGIYTGSGSTVTGNTSNNNGNSATSSYVYGIYTGSGSTVTGNTARSNGILASSRVRGIYASTGSTVIGNTAFNNGNSVIGSTTVYGIYTGSGSTVTGNTAYNNGDFASTSTVYGIYLGGYNLVDQNTSYSNGTSAGLAKNMDLGLASCVYGINVAP